MKPNLVQLEETGLNALNRQDYELAIKCFKKIIDTQPDYEHGSIHYHLACSYEDTGQLDLAKIYYKKALEHRPDDTVFLGGYVSYLYLHEDLNEALSGYIQLFKLEKSRGSDTAKTMEGLNAIAKKLRLSDEDLNTRIRNE